jgi:chitinase
VALLGLFAASMVAPQPASGAVEPELPVLRIDSVTMREPSGATNLQIGLTLNRPASGRSSVAYTTVDGTATAGSDYNPRAGRVTFSTGQTRKHVTITLNADGAYEQDEYFTIELSDADGLTLTGDSVITIINDDPEPLPTVNAISMSVPETAATKNIRLALELTHPVQVTTSVAFTTVSRTARAGFDYNRRSGTVIFGPGQTYKEITVTILGDGKPEQDEYFLLTLFSGDGLRLGDDAVITITNDDPLPELVVDAVSTTATESSTARNLILRFELNSPAAGKVTVGYETRDGSAIAGEDYNARSGVITFGAGQQVKQVPLTILGDGIAELDETFSVVLFEPNGLTIGDNAVVTIIDDDMPS